MSFKLWSTRSGQTTGIGTLLLALRMAPVEAFSTAGGLGASLWEQLRARLARPQVSHSLPLVWSKTLARFSGDLMDRVPAPSMSGCQNWKTGPVPVYGCALISRNALASGSSSAK